MKKLCILGAGGHGRVIADIAQLLNRYEEIFFLDDNEVNFNNVHIKGKISDYFKYLNLAEFIVAIGDNLIRKNMIEMLLRDNAIITSLIHPNSCIAKDVHIGIGTVIMPECVINTGAYIERGVILNTCSSVDHDCYIGEFSHIAVGAHLCGTVHLGKQCMVGAGSTIINNIDICEKCIFGAGSVVVNSILEQGVYIGVPAKKIAGKIV